MGIFLMSSTKRSNSFENARYCDNALQNASSMKLNLVLLAALGIAVTIRTSQGHNTGTEEGNGKTPLPTTSLVVARITNEEAGFDTRNNTLVTALYISGTFTNTNASAINLHIFHVTGLDADGQQVANSDCDNSGGEFTGALASGETTNFKAELIDAKKQIKILKVDLN
jgi:hypothetical protein